MGIGAGIARFAWYVSNLVGPQVVEDLASYSPVTRLLDITYNEASKQVTADMLGLSQYTASFRRGLGCTLNIGDTQPPNELSIPELVPLNSAWPGWEYCEYYNAGISTTHR